MQEYNQLGYIDHLPPFSHFGTPPPLPPPLLCDYTMGGGGGGGGGGQYTLGYSVRGGGQYITRGGGGGGGGTIYPRVYCPGDNITKGILSGGDTFSRGTLYPPTPVLWYNIVRTFSVPVWYKN